MVPPSRERRRQAIVRWLMRQRRDEFQRLLDADALEQWISTLIWLFLSRSRNEFCPPLKALRSSTQLG